MREFRTYWGNAQWVIFAYITLLQKSFKYDLKNNLTVCVRLLIPKVRNLMKSNFLKGPVPKIGHVRPKLGQLSQVDTLSTSYLPSITLNVVQNVNSEDTLSFLMQFWPWHTQMRATRPPLPLTCPQWHLVN